MNWLILFTLIILVALVLNYSRRYDTTSTMKRDPNIQIKL